MAVFRAYDIRGIYPAEVHEDLAEQVGKAFGTLLRERGHAAPRVAVGGDVRLSTPALKQRIIQGLQSTGAHVVDIGMIPTPVLYFAVASKGWEGGLVVTASHNPGEYNGFKPVGPGGECLSWETGIARMEEIIRAGAFAEGEGSLRAEDVQPAYLQHLFRLTTPRQAHVVIDAANGACSLLAPRAFEQAGCTVTRLFCEPDGRFPNHEADPIKKKNLVQLQTAVRAAKADLGIAYDADGDRLAVVNDRGEVVETFTLFSLFIQRALRQRPGGAIVYEVVVSKSVEDTILSSGGKPILSRVGHSYIQKALQAQGAALAGENSGHYYFPENFGYDDAIFASLKAAELLREGKLSFLQEAIPRYRTSEEMRPACPDGRKFQAIQELQQRFRQAGYQVNDLDGVRVLLDQGWLIIRASNTGPQLVVRWEAKDEASFARIGALVREQLAAVGVRLEA